MSLQPNGAIQIRIPLESGWAPGQHVFIRFTRPLSQIFTSHPFTICSLPECGEAIFNVKPHHGITARLAQMVHNNPGITMPVLIDGPYGGMQETRLSAFRNALVIGGGSGAGFTLPLIEEFLRRQNGDFQTWRIRCGGAFKVSEDRSGLKSSMLHVVLAVRNLETRTWFLQEVDKLLSQYATAVTPEVMRIDIHVTDRSLPPESITDFSSDDEAAVKSTAKTELGTQTEVRTVVPRSVVNDVTTVYQGRPKLPELVRRTTTDASSSTVGIAVCGPSSMLQDVRNSAAEAQVRILRGEKGATDVYLHTEHFGW